MPKKPGPPGRPGAPGLSVSGGFWLETHDKTVELVLPVELITQTIGLATLDQRPDKDPIHPVHGTDIGVIALAAQGFLQALRTIATGQAGQLHRPTDRQTIGIQAADGCRSRRARLGRYQCGCGWLDSWSWSSFGDRVGRRRFLRQHFDRALRFGRARVRRGVAAATGPPRFLGFSFPARCLQSPRGAHRLHSSAASPELYFYKRHLFRNLYKWWWRLGRGPDQ